MSNDLLYPHPSPTPANHSVPAAGDNELAKASPPPRERAAGENADRPGEAFARAAELAAVLPQIKDGYRTSEFWLTLLVVVVAGLSAMTDRLPPALALAISALSAYLFHDKRTAHKDDAADRIADLLHAVIETVGRSAAPFPLASSPTGSATAPPASLPETPPQSPATPSLVTDGVGGYAARPVALALALLSGAALAILPLFLVTGCESTADGHRQLTPRGRQVLQVVGDVVLQAALNAAASAASQYAETGEVDGSRLAAASISGAAFGLRSLESTPQAASPQAIASTVAQSTDNPAIARSLAPVVAQGVQTAIQNGVAPSVAVEHAASQLDAAAAETGIRNPKSSIQ